MTYCGYNGPRANPNPTCDLYCHWHIGVPYLTNAGHKGDVRQFFFIKPHLFIEYYDEQDKRKDPHTFGPILWIIDISRYYFA
jgi:hypothetical protein